jgi:hypothetical protein
MMVELHNDQDTTIQPNASLMGEISGVKRQVDVLIDHRWDAGAASRIIVDAKNRRAPVDVPDIEGFEGMMRDCRAARGVLVCTAGWTEGALRRASDLIDVTLLPLAEALEFEWLYQRCLGPCAAKKSNRGGVLWGDWLAAGADSQGWAMIEVGKCDGCHSFHVWCQDCGEKFAVPDNHQVRCGCPDREWASVPESPASGHVGTPESIWLMMRVDGGHPEALDRRPIR